MDTQTMDRRRFLQLTGAVCAGLACGSLPATGRETAKDRPNILWITCEDTSPNLGCWGDSYASTPNLDQLAKTGVRYRNAFAPNPVCSPSRSTLLLGTYAVSTGTQRLRSRFPIPKDFRGYPEILRKAGYYCTNNVKTDYNTSDEKRLIAECWDECSKTAHWRNRKEGQPFFAIFNLTHTHQSCTSFVDRDFPIIRDMKGKHDPAKAPVPPYYPDSPTVRKTIANCYDAISSMDAAAGRILDQLGKDGLAEDTIVFFFPDHGRGLPRGKRTLYDSGLRVPLILHFPEKYKHLAPAKPGTAIERMVSFVDFGPALISLLELEQPKFMQGNAFLGPKAQAAREYVFGGRDRVDESYEVSRSVRDSRYLYIRNYFPHLSWMQPEHYSDQAPMRKEMAQLAREKKLNAEQLTYAGPTKPREELFDTLKDPHQVHNLAGLTEHKAKLERLRKKLHDWQMEIRDIGFVPEGEAVRVCKGGRTPWDIARDEAVYPLAKILQTAELVGQHNAVEKQITLLKDTNATIRYWAAVGLKASGSSSAGVKSALGKALDDDCPEVRVEAASALVAIGPEDKALDVLRQALELNESASVLYAVRSIELLGKKAQALLPAVWKLKQRLESPSFGKDPYASDIEFCLQDIRAANPS